MSAMTITTRPVVPVRRARARAANGGRVPARAGLRPTARGRAAVVVLALLAALGLGSAAQHASAGAPARAIPVTTWTVAPGETLWQIATVVAEPGADVRVVVAELIALNELAGASLQVGQQILVPRT